MAREIPVKNSATSATLGRIAWRRLKRNRAALASAAFIAVIALLAALGDRVSPYAYDFQDSERILEVPVSSQAALDVARSARTTALPRPTPQGFPPPSQRSGAKSSPAMM